MTLPTEAIAEFQEIYQRKFGVTLTVNESEIKAENFIRLMVLLTEQSKIENEKVYEKQRVK